MPPAALYLDTNILIYLFELHGTYSQRVAEVLQKFTEADGDAELITSTITITEFLAGTTSSDLGTLSRVPRLRFITLDECLAEQAADLQRSNNLQIGDAIHLATAIAHGGAGALFTNDKHLAKIAQRHVTVKKL